MCWKLKYYKLDGRMRFEVGGSGDADGKLDSPGGLFLAKDKVYVADTGNDRIQVFSRDGIYLNKYTWHWDPKWQDDHGVEGPVACDVTAGLHTFAISKRKIERPLLDKIVLSRTNDAPNGMGPAETHCP